MILNLERSPVFVCAAVNGRPEARITWFWDDSAIDTNDANVTEFLKVCNMRESRCLNHGLNYRVLLPYTILHSEFCIQLIYM